MGIEISLLAENHVYYMSIYIFFVSWLGKKVTNTKQKIVIQNPLARVRQIKIKFQCMGRVQNQLFKCNSMRPLAYSLVAIPHPLKDERPRLSPPPLPTKKNVIFCVIGENLMYVWGI